MRWNQGDGVVAPIRAWLTANGVQFHTGTAVERVGFHGEGPSAWIDSITLSSSDAPIAVSKDDKVLVTLGSQTANLSIGSMQQAPQQPADPGRAWRLWTWIGDEASRQLKRDDFGDPSVFFKANDPLSTWVSFTITMKDRLFADRLAALTGSGPRRQGLISLVDSPWLVTLAPLPEPHFRSQTKDIAVCWGFSLCHDRDGEADQPGRTVDLPITKCNGEQILREVVDELGFDDDVDRIVKSSICIPCLLPHAGSVWLVRKRSDRPKVVPDGAGNFAFLGQFAELPKDTMFTMEYSIRTAGEAVARLFDKPIRLPPVYQGDVRALWSVVKAFCL